MRRLILGIFALMGVVLAGLAGLLIMLYVIDQQDNDEEFTAGATHTPPPGAGQPLVVNLDNCTFVSEAVPGGQGRRVGRDTLPNGRPLPDHQPERVNIPRQNTGDRVLIQFTPDSSQQERNEYIRSINGRSRRSLDRLNTIVVTVAPGTAVDALPESPIVELIERDYQAGVMQQGGPNDPRYGEQWALPAVGMPDPWLQIPPDAPSIIVAVVDSGICVDHPDLAGRIVPGFDFVNDDQDTQDQLGHGCGVAGVIAASVNNGIGISGIAPNALIMPLRVLDATGLGNYSDIAAAIIYAADNGAQVINLSLGGPAYSQILEDAVNYAAARGLILVASSGNYGQEGSLYPGAYQAVISVGSVDADLQRSSFSNYGDNVDFYAPGKDILTTSLNGNYEFMTGTSFAAPYAAGAAVLMRALGQPLATRDGILWLYGPQNAPTCP